MLREAPNQPVTAKNQRKGFHNRGLAAVVRTDQYGMVAKLYGPRPDPPEVLNFE